ncbi:MAG TPA: SAM-dependent methyltransferase [Thermoanaerobaculia bacterium]|nr:SAM-dependent methyltransferase [Thermoanaerobaculia bacterium]
MPHDLAERLRERIRREGPISFADFMEAALYDPDDGYYARGARIGEGGDFVTSPSLSPAFAQVIARRFAADAARLDGPVRFVEVGSAFGSFLADFAAALSRRHPAVAARTSLTAIERSAAGRSGLARLDLPRLTVLVDPDDLEEKSVSGWIFANELFDALPVARVRGAAGGLGLEELRVDAAGGRFVWIARPAPVEWSAGLAARGVLLDAGQIAEIRPGAPVLHRRLARALKRGRIVLFDYGHRTRTLYHPLARPSGTLAVHEGGRRGGDPLERPGERDLTAHVDWDELVEAGESEGLETEGPTRQGRYLTESGIFDFVDGEAEKWRVYRLVDPAGMGDEISVLVQSRGV